ncbi:MAG TPA: autorepressor SdpR family transcription factor [Verrucomicrobium sp.]|nr:autorepressor SdpR family transcription factor [Verrucomicrobium sp.]
MTSLFQALNDDTRRAILDLLRSGDLSAGAIAEHFKLGKPTMSHHLDLLKRAGLVTSEKQGQYVIYSLSTSVVEDAVRWLMRLTAPRENEASATPSSDAPATPKLPPTTRHESSAQDLLAPSPRRRRSPGVHRRGLATDS